jgi:hypothetical protein
MSNTGIILLGFIIGLVITITCHPGLNRKRKIPEALGVAGIIIYSFFKIMVFIVTILGLGSIMSSAKEKYWDNK